MNCPFEKETSFGKEKGYTTCLNPNKRFRHCNHRACEQQDCEKAMERTIPRVPAKKTADDLFNNLGF